MKYKDLCGCGDVALTLCVKCGKKICFKHTIGSYKKPYCKSCGVNK